MVSTIIQRSLTDMINISEVFCENIAFLIIGLLDKVSLAIN